MAELIKPFVLPRLSKKMKNILLGVNSLAPSTSRFALYGTLLLIIIFWTSIFGFSHSFQGLHLIDDHEIITFNSQLNDAGFWTTFREWIKEEFQGIRFRPLWIFFKLLRIQLFHTNALLWLTLNMLIAILTTWLWFLIGLAMNWQPLIAIGFAFMISLGEQSAIYYRLGTPETLSTLLAAVVFYLTCLSAKFYQTHQGLFFNILQVLSVILLTLSKENFILILPAIIFFKIILLCDYQSLTWKEAIQKSLSSSLLIFIIFLISLGVIQSLKNSTSLTVSYADNFGFDISRFIPTFYALSQKIPWIILLIFLFCLICLSLFQKKFLFKKLKDSLILWTLIVVPQLVIYAKSSIYERYLLPALIGYAFWLAINFKIIGESSKILARFLSFFFIIFIIFSFIFINYPQFQKYSSQRIAVNQLLTLIAENTQKDDSILVVINPRSFFEFGLSLRKFLAYQLNRKSIYLASYGSQDTDFYTDIVKEAEAIYSSLDPDAYFADSYLRLPSNLADHKFTSIIIFPPFHEIFLRQSSQWFMPEVFKKFQVDLKMNDLFPFSLIGHSQVTIYCLK